MKYKVWDKVKMVSKEDWLTSCSELNKFLWKTMTILEASWGLYNMREDNWLFLWSEVLIEWLVEREIKPWDRVGVSDMSQEEADEEYAKWEEKYYIWKKKL